MMRNMTASERIANHIRELGDWRGEILAKLRNLIREASPELVEDWKWNTPVWSYNGNVVAIGAFQDHVKINFFKGHHLTIRTVSSTPDSTPKRAGLSIFTKAPGSMRQHLRILCAPLSFSTVEDQNPGSRRTKQNDDRLTAFK